MEVWTRVQRREVLGSKMAVLGVPTADYQESREKLIRCTMKWKTMNGVDDHKPRPRSHAGWG